MTFENVKVGDKVWSLNKGWGVVEKIEVLNRYPLRVMHDDGSSETYTADGKLYKNDKYPLIFWDEVVFQVPEKPLPKLEVDAKVVVWNHGQKHNMHFSHFAEGGGIIRMCTFDSGKTSFTTQETSLWSNYEVME